MPQPRSTIADKQAATRQLPALFAEIDALLTETIDNLVLPMRSTSPRFYEAYRVTRSVVDRRGGRGPADEEPNTPPAVAPATSSTSTQEQAAA